jgi:hypothetical protein
MSGSTIDFYWITSTIWHVPSLIRTLWLFFRVLGPGNRVWSTSKQTWSLQSHLIYVHLLKPEVTIYSHTLAARSYAKKVELAYPHPDAAIRDYLDQPVSDLHEGQAICWCLLRHLFSIVSKELTRLYRQTRQPTYTELARSWRRHMQEGQNRATIYDQVVKESRASLVCQRFMIPHPSIHCSFK